MYNKAAIQEAKRVVLAVKIIALEKHYVKNEKQIIQLKQQFDRMFD